MHTQWLDSLNDDSVVIVPTRSLSTYLQESYARAKIEQKCVVWDTPRIVTWADFVRLLWRQNHSKIDSSRRLLSSQQSALVWERVIQRTRYREDQLTLLNIRQTVRSVQRSWHLIADWQISIDQIASYEDAESQQFVAWLRAFMDECDEAHLFDYGMLANRLVGSRVVQPLDVDFKRLIWYAFDLKTALQSKIDEHVSQQGVQCEDRTVADATTENIDYFVYTDPQQELFSVLSECRERLQLAASESPQALPRINVIVPDLQTRLDQVSQVANDVFYPANTPQQNLNNEKIYRFSLGKKLIDWPLLHLASQLLQLLTEPFSLEQFESLARHPRLSLHPDPEWVDRLMALLHEQQMAFFDLHDLFKLVSTLEKSAQKHENAFVSCLENWVQIDQRKSKPSPTQWSQTIARWLAAWHWANELSSDVESQLMSRWQQVLDEFRQTQIVQPRMGVKRAVSVLLNLLLDGVFLPKSAASPMLISGIYEAIGQTADITYIIGMHDAIIDGAVSDPFVPTELLASQGYPEVRQQARVQQARQVQQSLLQGCQQAVVSFPAYREGRDMRPSPLYAEQSFIEKAATNAILPVQLQSLQVEPYQDEQGLPLSHSTLRGGVAMFEHQSNCAFKAYAMFRLNALAKEDTEFGLSYLDRGKIVHRVLEKAWQQLGNRAVLQGYDEEGLQGFCQKIANEVIQEGAGLALSKNKMILCQHEHHRLSRLLFEWLQLEKKRRMDFEVMGTEVAHQAELAGLRFRYVIDRIDKLENDSVCIIDYKTGQAQRADWLGERVAKPQLPLYAYLEQRDRQSSVKAFAFAKVKHSDCQVVSLSEQAVMLKASDESELWQQESARWESVLTELAEAFKQGDARVNPIDTAATCRHCQLQPLCRIHQQQSVSPTDISLNK